MKKNIGKGKRLSSMIAFVFCFIMLTPTVALGKFDSESAVSSAQIGISTKEIMSNVYPLLILLLVFLASSISILIFGHISLGKRYKAIKHISQNE